MIYEVQVDARVMRKVSVKARSHEEARQLAEKEVKSLLGSYEEEALTTHLESLEFLEDYYND